MTPNKPLVDGYDQMIADLAAALSQPYRAEYEHQDFMTRVTLAAWYNAKLAYIPELERLLQSWLQNKSTPPQWLPEETL